MSLQKTLNEKKHVGEIKYLSINMSPLELEIQTTKLLKLGFKERRKFKVEHLGKGKKTPRGKPDIIIYDDKFHINIEVTKTTKSKADREFNSIKEHLQDAHKKYPNKKCYCLYISPETFKRNIDSFYLFNKEGDSKIFPMDFITFNHFIKYLIENDERYFDRTDLVKLFEFSIKTTTTDSDILEYVNETIIKDPTIEKEIKELRERRQAKKNIEIEAIMKKIHNMLRTKYAKNPDETVKEVSKIIFLKMYEESKELNERDHENRCTIKNLKRIEKQGEEDPINYLFEKVKKEMKKKEPKATIFEKNEKIDLEKDTINKILELINGHNFVQLGIDIKGKIYELFLGSTMKNTALGQYFTPEELIDFMIKIAGLRVKDKILDPMCGTGRFLTKSMDYLIEKVEKSEEFDESDIKKIKEEQVYGIELSPSVYKIARMNMYIHGDGRSNIFNDNMITFNHKYGEKYDVILTNPPFGDINIKNDVKDFEKYEKQIIEEFPAIDTFWEDEKKYVKSKGYKGGSLLLQKALVFLKEKKKLLTIIDDGVLNTNYYKEIRKFIRKNYFIKAIISLPPTTFRRLAKSSPKASILYLVKKSNVLDVQKEPIFFAHAEKIGVDTRGRRCRNDLDEIEKQLKSFMEELEKNISVYGGFFNKKAFKNIDKPLYEDQENGDIFKLTPYVYTKYLDEIQDRLDFNYNHPKYEILKKMEKEAKFPIIKLVEIMKKNDKGEPLITSGTTPKNIKYLKRGEGIRFLGATNVRDNIVDIENCLDIEEEVHNSVLKGSKLKGGELLISMAGTIGRCGVYPIGVGESNINQAVAKIVLEETKANARYVSMFLNGYWGQLQFSQNRHDVGTPNINLEEIKIIKIILPDDIHIQQKIVDEYKNYVEKKDKLLKQIKKVESEAQKEFHKKLFKKD